MKFEPESRCGVSCAACESFLGGGCPGCIAAEKECAVTACAKQKGRRFCGECGEFPCEILMEYEKQPGKAGCVENCRRIKAEWVKAARAGMDPVSVCGHHCDFCFLGQWCGGCRSGYNCCSFATISPDGICPQVKCADEKGLEGCWLCTELDGCAKGYYGNQDEYVAKATAMFIRKHGKETYTEALRRAVEAGENYPKSFDVQGSVEAALRLLEQYR